jgi:hypothetical protein
VFPEVNGKFPEVDGMFLEVDRSTINTGTPTDIPQLHDCHKRMVGWRARQHII